ncbi:MAG: hypothetical protein QW275_02795, partial [Candidatus Anstonellaceae archaeon]
FALAVFSIALSSFTPLPAGLLLSLSAAEGATAVLRQEISKQAKLLASFAIGFLAIFSMAFNIANLYQAGALALMAGVLSALLMYFYEYSNKQVFSAIFIFLFASTLFLAILRMNSLGNSLYLDPSLSKALSSQEAKQSEKVYMIGFHDAAKFYLPSSKIGNQSELLQYIYFGKGKLESGSAVLISLQQVFFSDSYPSSASFVPLQYAGRMPSGGREFAIFTSPQGIAIARELDAKGEFALSDGILLDSSGRQYGSVPISRMVLLRQAPYENNLLIWISEGDSLPFMLKIYANQTDLIYVQDFGNVSLFKVK